MRIRQNWYARSPCSLPIVFPRDETKRLFANQVFSIRGFDKFVKLDREIDNVFLDILELIISKLSISFDFIKILNSNIEMEPIGDNYLQMVNFEIIT